MNTLHFIYALEVEKTGSITQAADNLFMTQPTLSKAIKELETSIGLPIFKRTSKGVVPTPRGAEFLAHAKKIVTQIEKMEVSLHAKDPSSQLFSLAIPRVSYIARAASDFVCSFDNSKDMEIDLMEASSIRVIDAVASGHFVLGLIRYHVEDEDYFLRCLSEKGLQHEVLWQSNYVALMRKDHPLAEQPVLTLPDFDPYIEVIFGDDDVPYIHTSDAETQSVSGRSTKRILVYERAMQFDLLRANPLTYMWVSPLPVDLLEQNGFVQRKCRQGSQFKDLLISRSGYRFSSLDRDFINRLYFFKNEAAYNS